MKILKIIGVILLMLFVGIQFIPTNNNQSSGFSKNDFMAQYKVPKKIKNKIQVSCYDCHSNNTRYPWYNKIQPAAWFLESHIKEGKAALNFSEWNTYSDRRKKSKLKSIINQIKANEMPLSSYTFIHRNALLSQSEKSVFITYMTGLHDSMEQRPFIREEGSLEDGFLRKHKTTKE